MKINITYPKHNKKELKRERVLEVLKWPFLGIGYAAPIVNIIFGGAPWSIIIIAGLIMLWNLVFNVDLVEYNRLSQFAKTIIYLCVMLFLIDIILVPGWAKIVVSIISFTSILVAGILFFSDIERQKQNMMPVFVLIAFTMIGTILGLTLDRGEFYWTYIVMGAMSLALIVLCIIVLGRYFITELKKRFHL